MWVGGGLLKVLGCGVDRLVAGVWEVWCGAHG